MYAILAVAKKQPDKLRVRDVWASVLDVEDFDDTVTEAVMGVYGLLKEVRVLISLNTSLNQDLYLSSFDKIERVIFPLNLNAQWSSNKAHLTDEALTRLEFCSEELSRHYTEDSLSEDDLQEIIRKTDSLYESLISSTLPEYLKFTLLEEVQRLRNAIQLYRIKGARGLKQALQATIGAVVANEKEIKSVSAENPDVIDRLGKLLDKLDSFTSTALKVHKVVRHPLKYLVGKFKESGSEQEDGDQKS